MVWYPASVSLNMWIYELPIFSNLEKIQPLFFKYFFPALSLLGTPIIHTLKCLIYSHSSLNLYFSLCFILYNSVTIYASSLTFYSYIVLIFNSSIFGQFLNRPLQFTFQKFNVFIFRISFWFIFFYKFWAYWAYFNSSLNVFANFTISVISVSINWFFYWLWITNPCLFYIFIIFNGLQTFKILHFECHKWL